MGFDSVLGGAEEGFDAQVLFNPFEEQLDPPAIAVEFGDGEGGEREVVGEELEGGMCLGVAVFDATQGLQEQVEGVDGVIEFQSQVFLGIQGPGEDG